MKLFFVKRGCFSLASLNPENPIKYPPDTYSQILHFCRSAQLFPEIHLLNTLHVPTPTVPSNKPLLYASLLQTCTNVQSFVHGLQFHAHVIKSSLDTDRFVGNSLLALYFKLGPDFRETRRVFDGLFFKDVISWTSMVSGYIKVGKPECSLELFSEMVGLGVEPNAFTISSIIKSNEACQLFGELPDPDAICLTSIISALTRNVMHAEALRFFYFMRRNHGFTFGTVLTACGNLGRSRQGKQVHAKVPMDFVEMRLLRAVFSTCTESVDYGSVIRVFREMDESDIYSFGTIFRTCAGMGAVRQGKEVHCQYVRRGSWRDVVEPALVNLYAKCGCIDFTHRIFVQIVVTSFSPDFLGQFVAFVDSWLPHSGLVDQGRHYFNLMTGEYGIKPGIEHYNCMVDLLGRAGLLKEAENLIETAWCRDDSSVWAVLLGSCTTSASSSTAEWIGRKMIERDPDNHMNYVLLANAYRAVGRWNDAIKVRKLMEDRGVKKIKGTSWVETTSKMGFYLDIADMGMA
ncbi:Pentatricopeptide repeat (PPR) superfamily protein [Hibiscus syriacus]|uniref:Pentatricopeptide repeat (PPR) superfamily protein n=1 Tax=Hibiscus syriacus TaxID=106335 RepID=A0A6A2XER6_HIBSY|nr:Pentatricopeptide repeat (PPR) superfamily protein [Hibiscus syriacus]